MIRNTLHYGIFVTACMLLSSGCTTRSYHGQYGNGSQYLVRGGKTVSTTQLPARSALSTTHTQSQRSTYAGNPDHLPPLQVSPPTPVAQAVTSAPALPARISEGVSIDESALPPNARPGECYARVYEPPKYETVTERVMVQEPSERIDVIPAQYDFAEEKVLVQEEGERLEVIPAEYDWVEEQVLVTPAATKIDEVPAQYAWEEDEVLVKPAHKVWKKGRGLVEEVDNATGDIMCLIEVPAEYKTVRRQVLKSPATTKSIQIPAEYTTVRKKVMVRPPQTRTVTIPAEYKTVKVKKLMQPEQRIKVPVAPQYETVTKQVVVSEGRHTWKRVLCETNLSADIVMRVQAALKDAGYEPGEIDGKIGGATHGAVEAYQRANGLAVGGLTYETLNRLGVRL